LELFLLSNKNCFIKKIKEIIRSELNDSLDINIFIGDGYDDFIIENKIILINKIDFKIDFEKEIFSKFELNSYKVYLYFRNIIFEEAISFQHIKMEVLELKEVVFKKNIGIKHVCINKLILRPYEINANIVVNVDNYSNSDSLIVDTKKYYIKNIEFEDPHVCNAKIFFIGTNFENGNFRNRLLDNVVFQNCNFANTYFLNSFLSKTTFLNCEFPLVKNSFNNFFLPNSLNYILLSISFFFVVIITVIIYEIDIEWLGIWGLSLYLIPFIMTFIFFMFIFLRFLEIGISKFIYFFPSINNRSLVNYHVGLADEKKINSFDDININKPFLELFFSLFFSENIKKRIESQNIYKKSLLNINSIYNDLKVNFKNSSNLQLSGDFHYSHNYNKIILGERFFDTFALKVSYIINGFGERFMKSIISIVVIFTFLVFYLNPNSDYISTPSTPPFLLNINLDNESKIISLPIIYTDETFLLIEKIKEKKFKVNSKFYAFDNRFDFNFDEHKIPKLSENRNKYLVKFYFATSHFTYPFTQESKKWFQNITKESFTISIISTIIIWLYLIGMATALFNRTRR
jgi:hypothetical protein